VSHRALALLALLLAVGDVPVASGQGSPSADARLVRVSRAWPVMGTMLVVSVWTADPSGVATSLLAARDSVRLVDSLMSTYRGSSDVSRVNAAAGRAEPVRVAEQTMSVLSKARLYWRLSDGAFDPTVGPLVRAWGFDQRHGHRPAPRALDSLRRLVGFEAVELDSGRSTVRLPRVGMALDLGGIAKGFALDLARRALRSTAIRGGTIDLGGNMLLFGRPPSGDQWRVEIVDPLNRDRVVGGFTLDSGAVATSGDYEHYVLVGGKRYGHLLDPRTGEPSRGVLSATAIGPLGEWSDGLSATLFLLGPHRGARLADSLPNVAAIWVSDRGQLRTAMRDVVCSSRAAPRFVADRRLRAAR
jgi:thiamine biosynthesis lipoprotein